MVIVLLVLAIGFLRFISGLGTVASEQVTAPTDAIVVLTGGPLRIESALELLRAKAAPRMLISGVNPRTADSALIDIHPNMAKWIDCCIEIDRVSADTISNARQTAIWAARHSVSSVALVTSAYHMPRAIEEMNAAMPAVQMVPVNVPDRRFANAGWLENSRNALFLAGEYLKFLSAVIRIQASQMVSIGSEKN